VKITVDRERCSSIGACEGLAPDFFEINDAGELNILDPHPAACHRALIEDAVASCPTAALALHVED
jgi:ferredoxin